MQHPDFILKRNEFVYKHNSKVRSIKLPKTVLLAISKCIECGQGYNSNFYFNSEEELLFLYTL